MSLARAWKASAKRARGYLAMTDQAVDSLQGAVERLRPGHAHRCNTRFVHGDGEWCTCHVRDGGGGLATLVRLATERDALREAVELAAREVGRLPDCRETRGCPCAAHVAALTLELLARDAKERA